MFVVPSEEMVQAGEVCSVLLVKGAKGNLAVTSK